jgi:hypothetical protein
MRRTRLSSYYCFAPVLAVKASAFSVETKAACYRLSKLMFLSTYEGVRFIVFAVAVQRDPIHKKT